MSETSIVLQLQDLASDPKSDIEELLNKALLVSRKLKIKDFRKWCELELEGYGSKDLPEYRKFKGLLKVVNPFHGMQPFIIPSEFDDIVTAVEAFQSIGDINNLLKQEGDTYLHILNNETKQILMSMQNDRMYPLEPRVIFYRTQLMSIPTKVRNIVLNWSLQLEEDGILGEGLRFSEKEKEAAMSINHFNIQNMQGVAGSVSGGTINQNNQMNVQQNDFDSLAQHLMQNKVEFSDIQNLKDAIDADPTPTEPNKLGGNVSSWIGNMIGKAANGSWDVSIAVAGTLLADAIAKFYGLS